MPDKKIKKSDQGCVSQKLLKKSEKGFVPPRLPKKPPEKPSNEKK